MIKIEKLGSPIWQPDGCGAFFYWHLVQKKRLILFGKFTVLTWESSSEREYDYEKGVYLINYYSLNCNKY